MGGISNDRALWLANHILPHEAWLRGQLMRNGSTVIDIDDVIQEAYARLIKLASVDHIRNPRTYFQQTARSIVLQEIRRSRVVSIEAVADLDGLNLPAGDPLPDQQAESRQELRLVASAIAALPAKCREVYILRKVDGLSQREIAERLGVTESNVEKHLGRGVRTLMDIFGRGGKAPAPASMEEATDSGDHGEARDEQRN